MEASKEIKLHRYQRNESNLSTEYITKMTGLNQHYILF